MALYNETDDWQRFAREQMQNSAQNLQQKQAGLDAAKNQKTKTTLESALSGLFNGLKERGSDILNTVKNIEKTKYGWLNQIGANKSIENAQKDDSARRNEIAKKYGFNSYSEAINSDKVGDDFWNEIKANNEQTKQNLKAKTDAYRNNITDVTKVNTNEAKGQALNTIDSVLGLLPGGAGVVANVAGGGISGVGDEYKAAGREGRDVDWSNAGKNALVGMASGTAGSIGGSAVGKVAGKLGGSTVGKLVGSNVAKGTIGGAASGAVGGAVGTALNGGTLEDALLAAKEGAKAGAIGGGTMASVMGLGGTALDKIRNRGTTAQAIEPADAQIVQKNRIEAPMAERIPSTVEAVEPVSNKRGIAITDLDAGEQAINVRNANKQASRGKYIDGVVRGKNLPEAQGKTFADLGEGKNIVNAMANTNSVFGGDEGINFLLDPDTLPKNLRDRVKVATAGYADEFGNPYAAYEQYGITGAEGLPKLDRQEYYYDTQGKLKQQGGTITKADIPEYMQSHLRNDQNRAGYGRTDNESIMREIFGDNMSKEDMYRLYDEIASIEPDRAKYTTENAAGALAGDDRLRADVENYFVNDTFPTRKINIESALRNTQDVPVESLTTNYRRSTIPARQYEQAVKTMPEAEIVANRPTTAQIAPEAEAAQPVKKTTALSRGIRNLGDEMLSSQTNITRAERKRLGIDSAGEVVNNTRKRTGISDVFEQEEFARNITGSKDSVMDNIQRAQMAKNAERLTTDDYRKALSPVIDEGWSKTTMGNEKAKKQFIEDIIDDLGRKDPIDAANYLKSQAAAERAVSMGNSEGAPKAKMKAQLYTELANKMDDLTYSAVPEKNVKAMFDDTIIEFRTRADEAKAAGNKQYAKAYEKLATELENIPESQRTIQKYRSFKKDFVKSSQVAQISAGARSGSLEAGVGRGFNVKNKLANTVLGPVFDKGLAAAGGKLADIADRMENKTTANNGGRLANGAKNLVGKAAGIANNATASLNNESLANLSLAGMNTLGNQAQQFANKQMGKAEAERSQNRLENAQAVANAQADYDNALADYNAQEANYNANMATVQNQATGASQLDRIAAAMEMALNAGDITAYGQLADLYTQAAKIEELRNPTSNKTEKALSANQAKALTAQQQLEALAQMSPDAGTVASGIPLLGNIVNLTGGNEYANQASSLATTLGYLLSGANIKESEAQRIGQAYVPTAFDSEAVRQQKLERARQLIQSYMADTGALEA